MRRDSDIPTVVLVGGRGFGAHHLVRLRKRASAGSIHLSAIADPALAAESDVLDGTPVTTDLEQALALQSADIVVIATPIGTHADLCETALRSGADVLLEKPPTATFADFERLIAVQRETGRAVQVGFQSLGSHALPALADPSVGIGTISRVSATGLWSRPLSYWQRSPWAGKRVLGGLPVVDGVATNPLAHAVATALHVAGLRTADDVASIEVDLYRVNAIAGDDTSVVRITGRTGSPVTCALTLCAPPQSSADRGAAVVIEGELATASLSYTTDVLTIGDRTVKFARTDLFDNLLAHRAHDAELCAPLEHTGAFIRVLEAIRTAPEPTKVSPEFVTWHGEADAAYPVIEGIEDAVRQAASEGATFAELGVPWAHARRDSILSTLCIGDRTVAAYRDGGATIPFSSPRPYLHPIRTRAGVIVSAQHPADHDWHVGLSFAVQDANGVNFWGGRTYIPGEGYVHLDDHGRIVNAALTQVENGFEQQLTWVGPDESVVLREDRTAAWREIGDQAWFLDVDITLTPPADADVVLGSPGSKGRSGAGYGGLFWRLPDCRNATVFTHDRDGEDAVNGTRSAWIAWSAEFLAQPGGTGEATLVLIALDENRDPWFVRLAGYPGFGSAVAWDSPTTVPAHVGLHRSYSAIVADGALSRTDIDMLIQEASE
ncbi:DUF6807 family protein [Paramicrobacterium fandaimingii]|uniref:DUF6807 family protein n=1 Tax=Paramicrobacterium fandaimingii TaxID=2708079 RepID=UPI001421D67B|nr:DUF6807 family protein [Microbacterium fandaimingii]